MSEAQNAKDRVIQLLNILYSSGEAHALADAIDRLVEERVKQIVRRQSLLPETDKIFR